VFEDAMGYVALSRVKTLDQVHLIAIETARLVRRLPFGHRPLALHSHLLQTAPADAARVYSNLRASNGLPAVAQFNTNRAATKNARKVTVNSARLCKLTA
jgi:hypothetical protein